MASSRGRSAWWHLGLLLLAVKQMASLIEAGRPYYGPGDEGGGMMYHPPHMDGHYDFRCNSGGPMQEKGPPPPPPPYSECGNLRKAATSKFARTRQWVYYCVMGKARQPPPHGGAYAPGDYDHPPYPHPPPPRPRGTRSGPYFPEGPPHNPDYHPRIPFPPPPGRYERPYDGGGGDYANGGGPAPPRPTYAPSRPPGPWDEEERYSSSAPAYPGQQSCGGQGPGGYGGPMDYGPPSQYGGGGEEEPTPKSGPESRGPMQFEQSPDDNVTAATPPPQPRRYSPYMRYGLRLIQ